MKIKTRKANSKDIEFILKLTKENMQDLVPWNDEMFLKSIKLERILIALLGDKAVGLLDCEKKGCDLYIHNIQVNKEVQRKNIGSLLMDKAFLIAGKLRCKKVVLKVLRNNLIAKNFYRKIGFSSFNQDDRNIYLEKELES